MKYQYAVKITCIVGIILIFVPISYRDFLMDIGVAPVIDPIGAVGFYGGYPVGVGSAAVAIGITLLLHENIEAPSND
jgi:hypothetical protein